MGSSTDLIVHRVEFVLESEERCLGQASWYISFCRNSKGADLLEHWLCMNGFPVTTIHSDRALHVNMHISVLFSDFLCTLLIFH